MNIHMAADFNFIVQFANWILMRSKISLNNTIRSKRSHADQTGFEKHVTFHDVFEDAYNEIFNWSQYDQNWSWSCGLARLLLQDQDQDGTGLARPSPRLGLQEQDQTNTEAARPRPKQDHHYKTLAKLFVFVRGNDESLKK
ncbi:Uncharacterized protein FWK35_00026034 [Aphis craccivora]|uniref:Uncharacterized protein n=1 Tax=Aphis craccivora TaxID=307492 RepID=A0A6G0YL69_APHCR|nr:Uncharacterized protein FWK35_00026034 [Aphis craccivora]